MYFVIVINFSKVCRGQLLESEVRIHIWLLLNSLRLGLVLLTHHCQSLFNASVSGYTLYRPIAVDGGTNNHTGHCFLYQNHTLFWYALKITPKMNYLPVKLLSKLNYCKPNRINFGVTLFDSFSNRWHHYAGRVIQRTESWPLWSIVFICLAISQPKHARPIYHVDIQTRSSWRDLQNIKWPRGITNNILCQLMASFRFQWHSPPAVSMHVLITVPCMCSCKSALNHIRFSLKFIYSFFYLFVYLLIYLFV
jgi:hypothetical protein